MTRNTSSLTSFFGELATGLIAIGLVAGLFGLPSVSAQTTNWLGGSGNWTDVANWDNGLPGSTTTVHIDNGNVVASDVALNSITTINNLIVDVDDLLRLQTGCWLQFTGVDSVITNNGLIQFEGNTSVRIVGDSGLTIGGSGTIRLEDGQHLVLGTNTPAPLLVNGAGHTIEGAGGVGGSFGNLTNHGLIQATTSSLTIRSADQFVNTGTVRATNGQSLFMFSQTNNGNGVYEADGVGSRVAFFGGSVTDIELRGINGGIVSSDSLLELHDVSNSGLFLSQETTLFGTLNNTGEIQYRNINLNHMDLATDLTVSGGGIVNNSQGGSVSSGGFKLTNLDNTFSGFGHFDTETEFAAASSLAPGISTDSTASFDFTNSALIDGTMLIELGGMEVNSDAPDINLVNTQTGASVSLMRGLDFDQLNFFEIIMFGDNALLDVQPADGFNPEIGDFFDVLTADQFSFNGPLATNLPVINGLTFATEILNLFDPSTGTNRDVFRLTFGVGDDLFTVTRGEYVSGGLPELAESDNMDLSLRRLHTDTQSRTEFEVMSTSPTDSPASFEFTLEGAVFARSNVVQTIELFDYVAAAWEIVDTRDAARSPSPDSVVTATPTGDLSRFVAPGTRRIEARVRYKSDNPRQNFASNTDRAIWTIGQ